MSREVRRVPLDFDAPIGDTWAPLLMPDSLRGTPCLHCGATGYSEDYRVLHQQWWGYDETFDPRSKGSEPFTWDHPEVKAFAARNLAHAPEFYGVGTYALMREGERLAHHWNKMWMHHLSQDDVDILVASERGLPGLTHRFVRGEGYVAIERDTPITAREVNEHFLGSGLIDGIGSTEEYTLLSAILERDGKPLLCATCNGEGSLEAYPGQSAEQEAWTAPEVPKGEGWQMWQTVSEGGPVSPVFSTPDDLARWMLSDKWKHLTFEQAVKWVTEVGYSIGSFISTDNGEIVDGVTAAADK